jgi:sulfite reductase (NADPH) flavoprotein alpha-component
MRNTIYILYGTTTGNSEVLAEETAEKLSQQGFTVQVCSMENFNPEKLYELEALLVIISTDCDGEPPLMAEEFYKFLSEAEADLGHLSYSVLALGDAYYTDFCQTGKDVDSMFEKLGAHRISERVDCDMPFWEGYDRWFDNVLSIIMEKEKALS